MGLSTSIGHAAIPNFQGHVGVLSNQFHTDVGNVPGNRSNADVYLDYYNPGNPEKLESRFTLASLINDQGLVMFSLQEGYVSKQFTSQDSIKLGRQVLPWSTVDSTWGFGKVNNRRNFDYFNPGQEGLIGIQYEHKFNHGIQWSLFGSGLYVPETNPALDIHGNKITSRHPWADPPAEVADVSGTDQDIRYHVKKPSVSDIIWRYSGGTNVAWDSKHWVANGFVMRKPENQISVSKVDISLDPGDNKVDAVVSPQVYYHDLYGGNLRYRNADLEMYISGIAIRPNTFPDGDVRATQYTDIKTEKKREDYVGGGIVKSNDIYGVGLNYVARLSPFDRDRDTLATDPRWNQAVNLHLRRAVGPHLNLSGDLKYDMLTTDRLVMVRASYLVSKAFQMNLGVNMIGTPNNGKSYWSPFTNNDAAYAGLRYIF